MDINNSKKGNFSALIIGLLLYTFFIISGVGLDRFAGFIDIPSVLCVYGLLLAMYLIVLNLSGIKEFCGNIKKLYCGELKEIKDLDFVIKSAKFGHYAVISSGIIGSLIGLINMLWGGIDNFQTFQFGCAVMLITMFYGVVTAAFFKAIEFRAESEKLHIDDK